MSTIRTMRAGWVKQCVELVQIAEQLLITHHISDLVDLIQERMPPPESPVEVAVRRGFLAEIALRLATTIGVAPTTLFCSLLGQHNSRTSFFSPRTHPKVVAALIVLCHFQLPVS
jgi:hypothetical protein